MASSTSTGLPAARGDGRARTARLTVLYDADCGLCARCAGALRRLDRARRLRLLPLQAAGSGLAAAHPEERLLAAMHVVDATGTWEHGGAAALLIADLVPVLRPIAIAGRVPAVARGIDRAYDVVARNRYRLSRLLGLDRCSRRQDGR